MSEACTHYPEGRGETLIEVRNLTKKYGDHYAIEDLNFTIEKGKIYGFLGPNGAGKSTTMNIITGCLAATAGEVTIDGHDIFEEPTEAKKLIGYLPELPPVYLDRTIREYLKFVAEAKGVAKADIKAQIEKAMEYTKITDYQDRLIKNLSKGYRQRVGIAQALIGDPELIILDEPTVGLDPQQIIEIRDLISSLRGEHTVILSSHILSEVQAICEIIMIISRGHMVAVDTPDNLEHLFEGMTTVELLMEGSQAVVEAALKDLENVSSLMAEEEEDGVTKVVLTSETDDERTLCRNIFTIARALDLPILQMKTDKASLEDIFIELTNSETDEDEEEASEVPELISSDPGKEEDTSESGL
ncbi:MAG: ABC transporter ATP-binding protein [Lachnospiraceae bacterium]|nr:ABC transporter ATP-binding protein [Lachnospiraceae bacterium]